MNLNLIRNGETIVYHTGFLANDRDAEFSKLPRNEALELDNFANQLFNAAKNGKGILLQKKIEDNLYAYTFTKL